MERKRFIRITNNRIFLTPEMSLPLSQTSLNGEHLSFRTVEDIFFEIEVIEYDNMKQEIMVQIVSYQPTDVKKFNEQTPKAPVRFIWFKPLSWQRIERYLASYTMKALLKKNIVFEETGYIRVNEKTGSSFGAALDRGRNAAEGAALSFSEQEAGYESYKPHHPVIETIMEEAKIYFNDAVFELGFISFPYKSKALKESFNLKIENHYLLPEFNAIRNYFPKALGGKKQFSIKVRFTVTDNKVTDIVTTSSDIDRINEDLLDSVKRMRIAGLTKTPLQITVDKSLFTSSDIFDSFKEEEKDGNVFNQSEQDILNMLIEAGNIRNARQLQYLSGSKHSANHKLRFTLKPNFGFLFFIEGETKNHFCWELLNSHATYLWSFDKMDSDINWQYKRIEEIINIIRDMGRENYKQQYRSNPAGSDLIFSSIDHRDAGSALKDGFVEWQHRLRERLV
jgi:hypothetical protein